MSDPSIHQHLGTDDADADPQESAEWRAAFASVLEAAGPQRARQLMAGARPIIEISKNKPPVLSLREIATAKVKFDRDVREALSGKYDPPKP